MYEFIKVYGLVGYIPGGFIFVEFCTTQDQNQLAAAAQ
jgi:hypothetical protein